MLSKSSVLKLTPREKEVLLQIAKGATPREMAADLGLSTKTVSTYRERLKQKTGLRSNAQLAVAAFQLGWISPVLTTEGDS